MAVYDSDLRTDPARLAALMAGASSLPYWLDDEARPAALPPLAEDLHADLVVVGGGYCGLWSALLSKHRDPARRVVLLEARRLGWAASGRNGGFIEATLTHGEANGERYFKADLELLDRLGRENFRNLAADLDRFEIDAEYEHTGELTVAVEPHQVEELRAAADQPGDVLEGEALRAYTKSPLVRAATFDADDAALVHPGKLVWGLRQACLNVGVEIFEHTPITRLEKLPGRGGGVAVSTRNGDVVRAAQVVLATNGFPSLLLRNRFRTLPVYDYVLMTEPLSEQQLESIGWVGRYGIGDMSRQFHYYRKTADNRILWGGYDAIYHRGGRLRPSHDQREESFLRLADHFVRTFPQLGEVRFTHRWGGMIDMSTRLVAFHGTAMDGNVAYSSGFTGLGLGSTRFAAAVMIDLLAGERTERTENRLVRTKPLPIPPEPFIFPAVQVVRGAIARSDRNGGQDGLILRSANLFGFSFDS